MQINIVINEFSPQNMQETPANIVKLILLRGSSKISLCPYEALSSAMHLIVALWANLHILRFEFIDHGSNLYVE